MKKISLILAMLLVFISLTGCADTSALPANADKNAENAAGSQVNNTDENADKKTDKNEEDIKDEKGKEENLKDEASMGSQVNDTDTNTEKKDEASVENQDEMCGIDTSNYLMKRPVPEGYGTMSDLSSKELVANLRIGWNLGNTMDAEGGETAWGNPKTTKEMIDAVAAKGFNVIRIPTSWGQFANGDNYKINETFLKRVGEIVDYALANDMYVILNTHHETSWIVPTKSGVEIAEPKFEAVWTQIAFYFADYGDHLIFEGLNEPRQVGGENEWNGGTEEVRNGINRLEQDFVDVVRATGGNNSTRLLLVTSEAACLNTDALEAVAIPDDDHIAVSLHAYTPYDFTFQHDGDYDVWTGERNMDVDYNLGLMKKYFLSKDIPVIITEFGAERKTTSSSDEPTGFNDKSTEKWAAHYVKKATELGIPCVWWDNNIHEGSGERFGIFVRRDLSWSRESLVDAMMEEIK